MQCSNNLKQLSLAVHTFHDAHDRFPASAFDPMFNSIGLERAGFLLLLFPFIEQNALYSALMQFDANAPSNTDAGARELRNKPSASVLVSALLCPSNGEGRSRWVARTGSNFLTFSNYRGSRADLAGNDTRRDSGNGYHVPHNHADFLSTAHHSPMHRSWLRAGGYVGGFSIITSGASNTVAFSEGLIGLGTAGDRYKEVMASGVDSHHNQIPQFCLDVKGPSGTFRSPTQATQGASDHWLGRRSFEPWPGASQFYTLLPPNSPSCQSGFQWAWISATSNHTGGVNASFMDGAVRFISDTINTTNLHRRPQTLVSSTPHHEPFDGAGTFSFGVWAELGAINSTRSVSL